MVGIVGSGYVGTVVAACFAKLGHSVVAVEKDPERRQRLLAGDPGFHEDGLSELLVAGLDSGALIYDDVETVSQNCEIVFLCVGTPPLIDGHPDVADLDQVVRQIGRNVSGSMTLVIKSTAPVGTSARMQQALRTAARSNGHPAAALSVVSNPEFLREGTAINDFLYPDRIVLGGEDDDVAVVAKLYEQILQQSFPAGDPDLKPRLITTDTATAELAKYASNAFLATKISFINQIAQLSDSVSADITVVADVMGTDPRIGPRFLNAGVGWGGSCFGKDLDALIALSHDHLVTAPLLEATLEINRSQRAAVIHLLERKLGELKNRRIGLLGLAFKPDTSDTRDSPAVDVTKWLLERGARVVVYDPEAVAKDIDGIEECEVAHDPYSAAESSDAVVVMTDWSEFRDIDFDALRRSMTGSLVIDGRNMLEPSMVRAAGLEYVGIGQQ